MLKEVIHMKRILFTLVALILSIGLVACSDSDSSSEEKDVENVESSGDNDEKEGADDEADEEEEEKQEINKEIVDNDDFTIDLISVEKKVNTEFDEEKIEVKFEVENKRDDTITVQAREVSADGKMIDPTIASMSTDVSSGKVADAILNIQDYEGGDLPEIEEDLELILNVVDMDDYDYSEEVDVSIEF